VRRASLIAAFTLLASPALAFNAQRDYSDAELARFDARLARVADRVQMASADMCDEMRIIGDCSVRIVMDPDQKGLNAHAKRGVIVVNPAMVDFAKSDDQLAFVLAHESAHHFLGHIAAQRRSSPTDLLFAAPDSRATSRIETEADYAALYVIDRAGYSTRGTGRFLQMLSHNQQRAQNNGSHPANGKRSIAIQQTAAEIDAKKRKQLPITPNRTTTRG